MQRTPSPYYPDCIDDRSIIFEGKVGPIFKFFLMACSTRTGCYPQNAIPFFSKNLGCAPLFGANTYSFLKTVRVVEPMGYAAHFGGRP